MRLIKWLFSLFKKEQPITPEDRLWNAVEEFNEAWKAYNAAETDWRTRMRPWIDWPNKRMIMSVSTVTEVERDYIYDKDSKR